MEITEIISFPVVVPGDYSLNGFRMRNPDKLYDIHDEIIDRHFRCSQTFVVGEKLIAHICGLTGRWEFNECLGFITDQKGYFPNAIGLTLAFEQGERYLIEKLREPRMKNNWGPNIIGLDTRNSFWWTQDTHTMFPRLHDQSIGLNIHWTFDLTRDDCFGDGEDCLLYFTKQ